MFFAASLLVATRIPSAQAIPTFSSIASSAISSALSSAGTQGIPPQILAMPRALLSSPVGSLVKQASSLVSSVLANEVPVRDAVQRSLQSQTKAAVDEVRTDRRSIYDSEKQEREKKEAERIISMARKGDWKIIGIGQ